MYGVALEITIRSLQLMEGLFLFFSVNSNKGKIHLNIQPLMNILAIRVNMFLVLFRAKF